MAVVAPKYFFAPKGGWGTGTQYLQVPSEVLWGFSISPIILTQSDFGDPLWEIPWREGTAPGRRLIPLPPWVFKKQLVRMYEDLGAFGTGAVELP